MSFILGLVGGLLIGTVSGICLMCLLQINKKDCLHCENETASYCESCYQEVITKNLKLQSQNRELKELLKLKGE